MPILVARRIYHVAIARPRLFALAALMTLWCLFPIDRRKEDPHVVVLDEAHSKETRGPYDWPPRRESLEHIAVNGRITVATVSQGYFSFFMNWMASVEKHNITNVVVVALDMEAYESLIEVQPGRTFLHSSPKRNESAVDPPLHGTVDFIDMVGNRPMILVEFLKLGYTVLYSDIDAVWLRDPYSVIEKEQGNYDLLGHADLLVNNICTCFLYIRPTIASMELLWRWRTEIASFFIHDESEWRATVFANQQPFNIVLKAMRESYRINFGMLKAADFPDGKTVFVWEGYDWTNEKPCIIHANWLKGYASKKQALIDAGLWTQ